MLVPLALAWCGRTLLSAPLRILALVPAFLLIMYAASWIGNYFFHYNLVVGHVTVFGEGLLYMWYLSKLLTNTRYQQWPRIFQVAFVIFGLVDSFFLEGFGKLNTYTNAMESLLVTALILMYFEHLLHTHRPTSHLSREPIFTANTGIIIYLMGTVSIYLVINTFIITNDANTIYRILILSLFMQLILSSLLARCFWLARDSRTSQKMTITEC